MIFLFARLVLPCDTVRDVKWKSTSSIGNIILQTCVTKLQQTFRGIIYVILAAGSRFIQEGGVLRTGPYVRSSIKIESEWL